MSVGMSGGMRTIEAAAGADFHTSHSAADRARPLRLEDPDTLAAITTGAPRASLRWGDKVYHFPLRATGGEATLTDRQRRDLRAAYDFACMTEGDYIRFFADLARLDLITGLRAYGSALSVQTELADCLGTLEGLLGYYRTQYTVAQAFLSAPMPPYANRGTREMMGEAAAFYAKMADILEQLAPD